MISLLLLVADPSDLGSSSGSAERTNGLMEDLAKHQMFLLVSLLVLAHIVVIAVAFGCLWSQTPKRTELNQRFFDEQRAEIKHLLQKHE
jgi:hypothetical protein